MGDINIINFGSQYIEKSFEKYSVKIERIGEQIEKHEEIRQVLKRFQHGYTERNIGKVKEMASGEEYTCPIRLSAVISKGSEGLVFESIHFSFAHY